MIIMCVDSSFHSDVGVVAWVVFDVVAKFFVRGISLGMHSVAFRKTLNFDTNRHNMGILSKAATTTATTATTTATRQIVYGKFV